MKGLGRLDDIQDPKMFWQVLIEEVSCLGLVLARQKFQFGTADLGTRMDAPIGSSRRTPPILVGKAKVQGRNQSTFEEGDFKSGLQGVLLRIDLKAGIVGSHVSQQQGQFPFGPRFSFVVHRVVIIIGSSSSSSSWRRQKMWRNDDSKLFSHGGARKGSSRGFRITAVTTVIAVMVVFGSPRMILFPLFEVCFALFLPFAVINITHLVVGGIVIIIYAVVARGGVGGVWSSTRNFQRGVLVLALSP